MRIMQITSRVVCGEQRVGKWFCSDSVKGSDGEGVSRYLQLDGTWGKTAKYFDSKEEIELALAKGHKPDFHCDRQELQDRQLIREMTEEAFDSDEDRFD